MPEQNHYQDFFLDAAAEPEEIRESTRNLPIEARVHGEVLRIVYSNPENSYAVVKLRSSSPRHAEITLVGLLHGLQEGQEIEAEGRWELHREHGRQFKVESFRAVLPTTPEGIKKFLASGILPGIGETYAERIVQTFGKDTLHILDNFSERLHEVPGIGKKRLADIRKAWKENSSNRETMIFLQGLGISAAYCQRIINKYSAISAPEIVRQNPYRLATDIDGIGFLTADRIARQLGIEANHPLRLCAGVIYTLEELASRGNVCYPALLLETEAAKILGVERPEAQAGLQTALQENKVLAQDVTGPEMPSRFIYLRRLKIAELELAEALKLLLRQAPVTQLPRDQSWMREFARLNEKQRQAVAWALQCPCSIVTGGPGVGKTTVVAAMVAAAKVMRWKISLAAPTGRAAKRLSEATGMEAATIHRLLKWEVESKSFYYGPEHKLPCDILVIDEISMLDITLGASLFRAIAPGTRVVLVGDKDQLPSVGPGAVLHDLVNCKQIPVTFLTEIYRQSGDSRIIVNAHAVNQGRMPDLRPTPTGRLADFYWLEQDDPDTAADWLTRMVVERIPKAFGFDPMTEIQVLSPMHKGVCGIQALNSRLQEALNPSRNGKIPELVSGGRVFRLGDRVMQTANNYDKGVFNGEMGRISCLNKNSFSVIFDQTEVNYDLSEADQLVLSYAVTVHKSQGSEFPVIILPVLTQHYVMLQRNLIYTGMTRARKLLIMIGSHKALEIAVRNNAPMRRLSLLAQRLCGTVTDE
ncbi:MAG: ATP-dependent RecD-like DNA helicase [Lentisphaerae bacterium]|nr:ATP-dependent RecD-like DNA helicase [Lentisphaerota bacterium]